MTITLPKELEALVKARMKRGVYRTPEEMIRAGLSLLEAREKGMDALRSEILRGVSDIEHGHFVNCKTDDELSALAETTIDSFEKESGSLTSR